MCPQMMGHLLTWWGLGPTRPTRRYATVQNALQSRHRRSIDFVQVNQQSFNKKLKKCRDDSCKSKGTRWDDSCKSKGTRWDDSCKSKGTRWDDSCKSKGTRRDDTCKSKTRPSEPHPTLKCQVSYISGLS